ncbi:MAG: hypothetical protein IKD69_03705 [Solobacterium sp.]|nr:hypothetical protein [Solobacterium sp.]
MKGDPKNIIDAIYKVERGREIYDPASNAWYWLDASEGGAVACSKEVWMPYIYQNEPKGTSQGKWVRYNSQGRMVKGWYANSKGVYFYDLDTGEMYKGLHTIRGITYYFDPVTGVRRSSSPKNGNLK